MADDWDFVDEWVEEVVSFTCSVCKKDTVPPTGPQDASILILGEFPGRDELKAGKPFVGPTGRVLKAELGKVGIDINSCRLANLWLHEMNKNKACFEEGLKSAIHEGKNRNAILFVGSEVGKQFLNEGIMDINGLFVKSIYFSAPIQMAMINPAVVFRRGGVGEVRFAIQRFAERINQDV